MLNDRIIKFLLNMMQNKILKWAIFFTIAAMFLIIAGYGLWNLHKSRTVQLFGNLVSRVETSEKVVALTFDDGPTPGFTDEIISILDDYNIKATFFLVGSSIEHYPEEARKLVEAGHEIGNHSYSHQVMILKRPGFVKREIETTDNLIRGAGFECSIHFRAPYGKRFFAVPFYLKRTGRLHIMWDIEPDSYGEVGRSPRRIVEHVVERVRPGSIILLHPFFENRRPSLEAIPGIVEELMETGYRFVTVSELLEYES